MTLTKKIRSNPYLKVSNCTDIADVNYAITEIHNLFKEFGDDSKMLLKLWRSFLVKKNQLLKK
jgi:hypothetical protein